MGSGMGVRWEGLSEVVDTLVSFVGLGLCV
jgi:hypothetical protein